MELFKLKAKIMSFRYVKNLKDQTKMKRTMKKKRRKMRQDFKMRIKDSEMPSEWSESQEEECLMS